MTLEITERPPRIMRVLEVKMRELAKKHCVSLETAWDFYWKCVRDSDGKDWYKCDPQERVLLVNTVDEKIALMVKNELRNSE